MHKGYCDGGPLDGKMWEQEGERFYMPQRAKITLTDPSDADAQRVVEGHAYKHEYKWHERLNVWQYQGVH